MKERKIWSKEEDEVLKFLKEVKGESKWSAIAKKMEKEFSISGRSGKQCRQRYHNHLDSTIKLTEWTPEEERVLFNMHEEVGNRWSVIAHHLPGRTDNGVKNHFYSKLRKSLRRINKIIVQNFKKEFKEIKTSLLYKIIETSESKFKISSAIDEQVAEFCSDINNKLYYFEENFNEDLPEHIEALKVLVEDILNFGKNDKRVKVRHRKSSGATKDLLHPNMYLNRAHSHSEYSPSQFSSHGLDSSSYCGESDNDQDQQASIGHQSMIQISIKQPNLTKSQTSNTNLRITRSRSKEQTHSSVKSPACFSDDSNIGDKFHLNVFTGDKLLSTKIRNRNPSFQHQKSQWSHYAVDEALMAENMIEQKSSGSNKQSRNSRSNSHNRSHVNLFFQDSHFQMRILSPRDFAQKERMSQEGELFDEQLMDIQFVDSVKTLNLDEEIFKLSLGGEEMVGQIRREEIEGKKEEIQCLIQREDFAITNPVQRQMQEGSYEGNESLLLQSAVQEEQS